MNIQTEVEVTLVEAVLPQLEIKIPFLCSQIDSEEVQGLFSDVWSENAALFERLMEIIEEKKIH